MTQKINKYSKTLYCFAVLFTMLLGLPAKVNAQEAQTYRNVAIPTPILFESASTTFTYLVGGATNANINGDRLVSKALPIGFTFYMGDTPYTTFYANSNGFISLNKTFSSGAITSTTSPITGSAILAPLWDYLNGDAGAFTYLTTGAAPNRVLTAEWKNWKWRGNAKAPVISFQVKIYEGTNNIEFIYKKEAGTPVVSASASIGLYNDIGLNLPKQMWLTNFTANPGTTAAYDTQKISGLPADGQLYRFIQNTPPVEMGYYGQTIINAKGGIKPMGANYDGIRINLSATGNMQVSRKNQYQIFSPSKGVTNGTTAPYEVPGTTHGLALSVGNMVFSGGTLSTTPGSTPSPNKLIPISSTQQSLIESSPGHFENVIKMSVSKGGLIYILEVKYTYVYPENSVLIDYKITIPEGNTEKVKLAHAWDTYLEGGDNGPGFKLGEWDSTTDKSKPNFLMGVKKIPSYEAFQYLGGIPWDGYFSASYNFLNTNLAGDGSSFMTFSKAIDTNAKTDNGIGISMDFGSAPGTFESKNSLVFACSAGDLAPVLTGTTAKPCTGTSFNLNSYVTSSIPEGVVLQWKNASGVIVPDPTNVSVAGTYRVSYYSPAFDCGSPEATITVTFDTSCAVCYKPAVTTGTSAPVRTIISTLDRTNAPRNWSDPRTGSLILESTNRGLVLTRIASPETAITKPVEGMIVYDTVNNVLKLYNGSVWHVMTQQGCPD